MTREFSVLAIPPNFRIEGLRVWDLGLRVYKLSAGMRDSAVQQREYTATSAQEAKAADAVKLPTPPPQRAVPPGHTC